MAFEVRVRSTRRPAHSCMRRSRPITCCRRTTGIRPITPRWPGTSTPARDSVVHASLLRGRGRHALLRRAGGHVQPRRAGPPRVLRAGRVPGEPERIHGDGVHQHAAHDRSAGQRLLRISRAGHRAGAALDDAERVRPSGARRQRRPTCWRGPPPADAATSRATRTTPRRR